MRRKTIPWALGLGVWVAELFDLGLDFWRGRGGEVGDGERDSKVDQHTDRPDAFGANAEEPEVFGVGGRVEELEVDDVSSGEQKSPLTFR